MLTFEIILCLLVGGVTLTMLAPKVGLPWPAVLALAGTGLAFIPGVPKLPLDPDLALALFFAPVLLDAAYDTSPRALLKNWRPVGSLVIVAVLLTVGVVALIARTIIPEMPWAAAIALGAIVAPPDAAAATSVLQQVRLPRRLVLILEGESLLNDASVLLIYRVALDAVHGDVTLWTFPILVAVGGRRARAGIRARTGVSWRLWRASMSHENDGREHAAAVRWGRSRSGSWRTGWGPLGRADGGRLRNDDRALTLAVGWARGSAG